MKKTLFIISAIVLLGLGGYFYFTNNKVRSATNEFVNKNILGKKEKKDSVVQLVPVMQTWVYELVDPTDIEDKQFAIPRIDTTHISQIIQWQYNNGVGGKYSLSYIDNYSKDNSVKFFSIPQVLLRTSAPEQNSGEVSYEYYNKKKDYKKYLAKFITDSTEATRDFLERKRRFLNECFKFLNDTVYVLDSKTHRRTDAAGSLNACFNGMNVEYEPMVKFLVALSDLEDNVKGKLVAKPDDISIIVVNPVPGSTKKILGKVPEVQSPEEAMERIKVLFKNQ